MWEFEHVSRPPKQPLPSRKESRKVMGFGLVFWKTLVLFKSDLQDPFPSFCSYQSSVLFMVKPLLFWVVPVFFFFFYSFMLDFGELSKKLAEVWKQLPEKDKLVSTVYYGHIFHCLCLPKCVILRHTVPNNTEHRKEITNRWKMV